MFSPYLPLYQKIYKDFSSIGKVIKYNLSTINNLKETKILAIKLAKILQDNT